MTMDEFYLAHGIRMSVIPVSENPCFKDDDWSRSASHFKCTLRMRRKRMTITYSVGPAVQGEPTAADVLDCVASDSSSYENARSFGEWASDLGMEEDSRRAIRIYKNVERQARRAKAFLGDDLYEALLWKTDRL